MDETRKRLTDIGKKMPSSFFYGAAGALIFILVYGFQTLNVTYDHWILNGYAENDIIQHYAGWMAYRLSAWHFPVGMMDGLGKSAVSFTDSIPWMSIFFKLFRGILPETFQFFGLYILLCMILQGIASGKIMELFSDSKILILSGVILFCTAPIMLERAFRHTALASHWLILFSIYFLLRTRRTHKMDWGFALLSVLAIGIHPYFLPMIYALFFASLLEVIFFYKEHIKRACVIFFGSMILTIFAGYCIGVLGTGSIDGGGGFGFYSMNMNALINPKSAGGFVWSRILPIYPHILGNYDGFNYLGLGCIIAVPLALLYVIIKQRQMLRKNVVVLAACVCLTLFAVSNVVTWNDQILFEYPLPGWFLSIAEIFRASSRMFYPVYYLLMLLVVWAVNKSRHKRAYLMGLILLVQLWDLSPAFDQKFQMFRKEQIEQAFSQDAFYHSEPWNDIAQNFSSIKMLDNNNWDFRLAAFGAKNKMVPDITISRGATDDLNRKYREYWQELYQGDPDPTAVYLLADKSLAGALRMALPENCTIFDCGNYLAVTESSRTIRAEMITLENDAALTVFDLTDEYWLNGILQSEPFTLLFQYSPPLEEIMQPGKTISTGEISAVIDHVDIFEGLWIYVVIGETNGEPLDFCYPAAITVQ